MDLAESPLPLSSAIIRVSTSVRRSVNASSPTIANWISSLLGSTPRALARSESSLAKLKTCSVNRAILPRKSSIPSRTCFSEATLLCCTRSCSRSSVSSFWALASFSFSAFGICLCNEFASAASSSIRAFFAGISRKLARSASSSAIRDLIREPTLMRSLISSLVRSVRRVEKLEAFNVSVGSRFPKITFSISSASDAPA